MSQRAMPVGMRPAAKALPKIVPSAFKAGGISAKVSQKVHNSGGQLCTNQSCSLQLLTRARNFDAGPAHRCSGWPEAP